jgi:hypothetical protein
LSERLDGAVAGDVLSGGDDHARVPSGAICPFPVRFACQT